MRRLNRMSEILEIPREVVTKEPKITVTGFEEVLIQSVDDLNDLPLAFESARKTLTLWLGK